MGSQLSGHLSSSVAAAAAGLMIPWKKSLAYVARQVMAVSWSGGSATGQYLHFITCRVCTHMLSMHQSARPERVRCREFSDARFSIVVQWVELRRHSITAAPIARHMGGVLTLQRGGGAPAIRIISPEEDMQVGLAHGAYGRKGYGCGT
eukprot:GHUV01039471.1.p1 GENE.GHUV01039471.1~~GHUV01039471.1.p1  ORF type:complete len:149 (-),score=11.88 GHUV01039471.1:313-759(-)